MYVVTVDEMRRIEREADAAGHSYAEMMERAGRAVARVVQERTGDQAANVLVLVGPGNNGGDGLVAGRYLHEAGYSVSLYLAKRAQAADPNLERAQALGMTLLRAEDDGLGLPRLREWVSSCDVIVDALLGSGATGAVRGPLGEVLRVVQALREKRTRAVLPDIRCVTPAIARRAEACRAITSYPGGGAGGQPQGTPLESPACREGRAGRSGGGASAFAGDRLRARPVLLVAVDVPSGLNCDTGAVDALTPQADVTVTFAYPKRGHFLLPGAERVGELWVADIGTYAVAAAESLLQVATPEDVAALLPARPPDAHKGSFGKALIVGGCAHYTGAPSLAARAAYRVGAGLVTLALAERIYPIVAGTLTEATYLVLPDDMGALQPDAWRVLATRLTGYNALLVGPGLGTEAVTGEFLHLLLGHADSQRRLVGFAASVQAPESRHVLPATVLDADALNLLARHDGWWRSLPAECVLTPHPGEMARLLGCDIAEVQAQRVDTAISAAQTWGCTVVLKGAYTVVAAASGRATLIPFSNPALATAGTGDVLAGAIVGLIAEGLGAWAAAVCGAYVHAFAGESWRHRHGESGMLASDLLDRLPEAVHTLRLHDKDHG